MKPGAGRRRLPPITNLIEDQTARGTLTVIAASEAVKNAVRPTAIGGQHFNDCPVVVHTAIEGGEVDIPALVESHAAGILTPVWNSLKAIKDGFHPRCKSVGLGMCSRSQIEHCAA